MKVNITTKLGASTLSFQVENPDLKEALGAASFFTDLPKVCGLCDNGDVSLTSNRDKENNLYVKIRCNNPDCKATSALGSPKDKVSYWWKAWEIYKNPNFPDTEPDQSTKSRKIENEEKVDDADLPF